MLNMLAVLLSSKPHPGALQTLLWKRHPFSKRHREGQGFQLHPPPPPHPPAHREVLPAPISSHEIKVCPPHKAIFLKGCSNQWQKLWMWANHVTCLILEDISALGLLDSFTVQFSYSLRRIEENAFQGTESRNHRSFAGISIPSFFRGNIKLLRKHGGLCISCTYGGPSHFFSVTF